MPWIARQHGATVVELNLEETQLTGGADYQEPSWAPDARHIVCARSVNYHSELYVLDTLGDPEVRLTTLQGDWYAPAWSPR